MTYEVEFKSPGKHMPFQYRDYTVRAQNVTEAEEKAFKQLQMDDSVDSDWVKNAKLNLIWPPGERMFYSRMKLTTSEQINDATQTRFIPDDVYDIRKDRPPLWSFLTIPFQLLVCKILDIKDYFKKK